MFSLCYLHILSLSALLWWIFLPESFHTECPAVFHKFAGHLDTRADTVINIGALILFNHMSPHWIIILYGSECVNTQIAKFRLKYIRSAFHFLITSIKPSKTTLRCLILWLAFVSHYAVSRTFHKVQNPCAFCICVKFSRRETLPFTLLSPPPGKISHKLWHTSGRKHFSSILQTKQRQVCKLIFSQCQSARRRCRSRFCAVTSF